MANHISLRYDSQHRTSWEDVLSKVAYEHPETEYVIFKEIAYISKKEHYHVHLICSMSINTLRNRFTRTEHYKGYPTKNDKSWYCRLARDIYKHLMYVVKDGDEIFSNLETINYKEMIGKWIPREDFKGDKVGQLYEYVTDHYQAWTLKARQEWSLRDIPDKEELVIRMLIREWHVKARRSFGKYMIDAYVNLIVGLRLYDDKPQGFETALQLERKLNW